MYMCPPTHRIQMWINNLLLDSLPFKGFFPLSLHSLPLSGSISVMRCFYTLISKNVVFHPMTFGIKFLLLLSYIAGESSPSLFCSFTNHLFLLLVIWPPLRARCCIWLRLARSSQSNGTCRFVQTDFSWRHRAEEVLETWLLEVDSGPTPGVNTLCARKV